VPNKPEAKILKDELALQPSMLNFRRCDHYATGPALRKKLSAH
jgi:hypothetical protein